MKLGWSLMILKFAHWSKSLRDLTCHATLKKRSILNRKAESPTARLGRRRVWATFMLIAFISCFLKDYSVAYNQYKTQHYKQYTFIQLNDLDEYYCIEELWHLESRWNYKAKNPKSSAAGIPQLLNLKEPNPFRQIDRGLRYIEHRYNGSACKALAHHKIKGWY